MITLECNGVEQSLEGWGITRATVRLMSLAADILFFDVEVQDMFTPQAFAYGDPINLNKDGVRIFAGIVTRLPVVGTVDSETQSYTVTGPWYYLSRIVYQQDRTIYFGTGTPVKTVTDSSRVLLFSDGSITGHVDSAAMIFKAISYAAGRLGGGLQMGLASISISPPMQEIRDATCADIILYAAKWSPNCVSWFDYSVDPPAFYCSRREDLTQVTIDPKNESTSLVNSLKITPRPDLQVTGVLFDFETTVVVDGVQKTTITSQTAGNPFAIDAVIHTFTLQGATDVTPEPPPINMALDFILATNGLQYEGELVLIEPECSFLITPAKGIQFTPNCPAIYQTMNIAVQQAQYELVTGYTTLTFGPPNQLGPQDYNALLAASRSSAPTSSYPTSTNPLPGPDGPLGTGNPPTPPASNPFPTSTPPPNGAQPHVVLELCDGTSVCVLGATGSCGT